MPLYAVAWTEQTCLQPCTVLALPTAMQTVRELHVDRATSTSKPTRPACMLLLTSTALYITDKICLNAGFVQGVGRGIIGAAAQPVSGAFEFMSSTFEGIDAVKDQLVGRIKPSDLYKRNRLPRAIGGDGRLQPFSRSDGSERQVILPDHGFCDPVFYIHPHLFFDQDQLVPQPLLLIDLHGKYLISTSLGCHL